MLAYCSRLMPMPNWQGQVIALSFNVHANTVALVRKRFVEQGLTAALSRKKQKQLSRQPVFDGAGEAHLIAISCSQPPEGYNHWSLRLLADRVVKMEIVPRVSYETVRQILKKRTQAAPKADVGDSTGRERGICSPNGRHPGRLPEGLCPEEAGGLSG